MFCLSEMVSVLGIILFYGRRHVSNCFCVRNIGTFDCKLMHGLYADNEAVSELTNRQNIKEKLATLRVV